jgi:DNA-binding transcriptional ArsR family regulator
MVLPNATPAAATPTRRMIGKSGPAPGNSKESPAKSGYPNMPKTKAPNREKIVDLVSLLLKGESRTIAELAQLTGMDRTTIYWWLAALEEEGIISRHVPETFPTQPHIFYSNFRRME